MNAHASTVSDALCRRLMQGYPIEAAKEVERWDRERLAEFACDCDTEPLRRLCERLVPAVLTDVLLGLESEQAGELLRVLSPTSAAVALGQIPEDRRELLLDAVGGGTAIQLRKLLSYPHDSVGRLMDPQFVAERKSATVATAIERVRKSGSRSLDFVLLIDDEGRLVGMVSFRDLLVAEPIDVLEGLAQSAQDAVAVTAPLREVVEVLERQRVASIPVIDLDGRPIGVFHHKALVTAVQEQATADIQTMVGASKEERALSNALFAVGKRLPWLQINLLTAFLAAAVVGLFEGTIAKFTALAVLLPVVAGQSGNAGAQALAVTMRGLALREITAVHWLRVTVKETSVGFLNGLAVAVTCGIGVYVWSDSVGLVLVITSAMVLAMVAAGLAGATVPIVLTRLGQDPAQSSSIILTTVTDVAGFFSFLGIATLLSGMLAGG